MEDEEQYKKFTDFRVKNKYQLQDISKVEYANGIRIMNTAFRLPKSNLTREILRQLGYTRTSSTIEKYIQEAIDLNVERGYIQEDIDGNVEIKNS